MSKIDPYIYKSAFRDIVVEQFVADPSITTTIVWQLIGEDFPFEFIIANLHLGWSWEIIGEHTGMTATFARENIDAILRNAYYPNLRCLDADTVFNAILNAEKIRRNAIISHHFTDEQIAALSTKVDARKL